MLSGCGRVGHAGGAPGPAVPALYPCGFIMMGHLDFKPSGASIRCPDVVSNCEHIPAARPRGCLEDLAVQPGGAVREHRGLCQGHLPSGTFVLAQEWISSGSVETCVLQIGSPQRQWALLRKLLWLSGGLRHLSAQAP